MKKITVLLSLILIFCNIAIAEEYKSYEEIFVKDRVIDIKIEISEEDLKDIYENPMLEEYHPADITVDGVTVPDIGIRTKGNSSLSSVARGDSDRYSYRIKFNKYTKGQKLLGLDDMVINNMFSDPSYMREYLSYEAMREAGMAAPLTVLANIYINGELKGLYLAVEVIDESFLKRTFGNSKGNLYKQEQGSTLVYSEDSEYPSSELKVGNDTEKLGLKSMIKVLNENGDLKSVLDIDSCVALIAANTVLGSYDSYNGSFAHNYYMYEQDGVVTAIPWDYNMSFGGFGQGGSGWSSSLDTPVSGASMEQRPLINNLLKVPEYKAKYLEYVSFFAEYLRKMPERTAELANIIRPHVEADPTKFMTMEAFENSIIYVEEEERTDMPGGGMRMSFGGADFENMQKAMEIIQSAAGSDLTEEQMEVLGELGLNDEQIMMFKNMPPLNMNGGERQLFQMGGNREGMPTDEGQQSTRGNMGGGERRMMPMPEEGSENTRGNMGGGMGGERRIIIAPEFRGDNLDETSEAYRPENGGPRINLVFGGGMGGGSIITYSAKRLESIDKQLNPEPEITVLLDDNKMIFDVSPIIENGRTLVPLRAIFEALSMEVLYDDGHITATREGLIINLTIGNSRAYVNNEEKTLDVAGRIVNDRTLVPLRFIGEATGLVVDYDDETRTVTMNH